MSTTRQTGPLVAGLLLAALALPVPILSLAQTAQAAEGEQLFCELAQTPASTRKQTRGVHTPAVRPNEYRAKVNEARAKEERVRQNRATAKPAQRFTYPRRNERPRLSSDRLTGR